MALTKRIYVDGETIITAQNLNDIQDEIIAHESNKVPITRTVNGKALSANITLSASDVGAVPTTRTVNSKALSSNITLAAGDIGYNSSTTYTSGSVGKAVSDINGALTSVENGLAIIVTGDTCSTAVPSGSYAYIKNNTHGLAEGLYRNKSSSAFPTSGGTANSTVFEVATNGGLNDVVSKSLRTILKTTKENKRFALSTATLNSELTFSYDFSSIDFVLVRYVNGRTANNREIVRQYFLIPALYAPSNALSFLYNNNEITVEFGSTNTVKLVTNNAQSGTLRFTII